MDGKDLCKTPYPNSGSHVDMFNLKQPRYQPGHTNIAINRGESNNVANISNSSFAADNTSNSSVGYRQGTFVRNKGVASAYERLGNSAMANMQAQQQHHQPQINPSNNRNANTNANLNALVRHQAPNQYGSNENLQMASHGKTTPLPYRVPVQQQQHQQQSQAQLINMQQGQRAYLQRHHQSHDPSSQQLQLDAASRTIDPRSQLQYQNYSYQSNYNRNIPSYHSSHQQLQQRRKTNDTTLAGNDGNNASSGTGGSYMDNSGGIHTGQYRNRQIASETSVNVNPQYHQIESNQPGKAQQQQQQSAMPSQHVASPILSPNYGRNDGISNIPTKSNPIQQQSLQTYAIQAQQLKLQTQQIDNRSILQRSLAQSGPKQTSQQSYFRPNYQNTHISQSQRQQVIQVPITRHSTGTAQVLQHKASSGLGTGNSMIQPSMTSVLEGQSRPTRHSPVNSMANSNNQATVFKQRTPALLNQSSGPSPSLKRN
ncbi:uncharacterized protein TRIADDRAFT_56442 [Trichoplax adhaerens]|uniref:Uncharacterized protein n=1 Tax=Trichoplax adhaerens TaxID=10228 RepID=B3RY53_TRIAD|nr:hypothetical protein TRIADDRAFT_56442 [Trichoplax adhaerens]EDV24541.1 hypothetical protein TRIADDRAFT_56442 [Trichoplax adhaerens]|eukprot:XP_002112431.1 hypothetical protein TRIADDRAFT_56442 [Trichoplax adhaerens]